MPEVPGPPRLPDNPVTALQAGHAGAGLHLHARAATPAWLGESVDVGRAIDVLHPPR